MKKILSLLVLLPIMVVGQTQTENYIKTTTYKVATATSITTPTITQANQNITYFDGLGRPIQQIAHQQSGTGKDIVTPIEYDAFGRQTKDYLPYVPTSSASLDYKSTALADVLNFPQYSGQNPFSEKSLEASPLNRVMKQAAPGADWALNSGHEIKLDYQTNTATDAVKLFSVTTTWNASSGLYDISLGNATGTVFYVVNQLYKTITYDENTAASPTESAGSTVEFKNKEGQVVLKRTYSVSIVNYVSVNTSHDTYYVYDQYGNLTFVIPPLVNSSATITTAILNDLCYQYKYDYRNRLVEKKIPGKQWEFIVYDKLDRVVATSSAFWPFNNGGAGVNYSGWLLTKYDAFNRVVYTAWYQVASSSAGRKILQDAQNTATVLNETKQTTPNYDYDSGTFYYTNLVKPTDFQLLTVNYYDNYIFPNGPVPYDNKGQLIPTSVEGQNALNNVKGLFTGTVTRILENTKDGNFETTYTIYDTKARPIRTYTKNYLGGYTQTDTKLNFEGQTLYTITTHKRLATDAELKVTENFTYSPQGRLLTHTHQIGTGTVQLLASNTYDELGQLISKKVGNTTTAPLQKVDYAYNIRGWMTGINNDPTNNLVLNTNEKDLFAFKINYNTVENCINYTGTALYNGNIAETYWRTASDNVIRKYGYKYDNLNRLKDAVYQKPGVTPALTLVTNAYNENLTYDKNGNITTLKRNGDLDPQIGPIVIDNLIYGYAPNSNRLVYVEDQSWNSSGYHSGFDDHNKGVGYTYDVNGNLTYIDNKNTYTSLTYNHLNLPTTIKQTELGVNVGAISYVYNANGQKVKKTLTMQTPTASTTTTDYLGGFQYQNNVLQFFPTAEGYFKQKAGSAIGIGDYVFNYTDHLGNIRLSYQDKNSDTVITSDEILEETHYYPFGMKHKGYVTMGDTNYKYKFQGQERQDELGLNWDSFKWRNYDPAMARFMNIDPLSEKYAYQSHYNFSENRVIDGRELEGLEVVLLKDTAHNKPIIEAANNGQYKDNPETKTIHVFAHGNPSAFFNENVTEKEKKAGVGTIDSGASMNNVLNQSELWKNSESKEGFTIVLHSCRTGKTTMDKDGNKVESVAEKISKEMPGVSIIAPDERDGFSANGNEIGPQVTKNTDFNAEYLPNTPKKEQGKQTSTYGNWNTFSNGMLIWQSAGNNIPKNVTTKK